MPLIFLCVCIFCFVFLLLCFLSFGFVLFCFVLTCLVLFCFGFFACLLLCKELPQNISLDKNGPFLQGFGTFSVSWISRVQRLINGRISNGQDPSNTFGYFLDLLTQIRNIHE